MMKERMLQEIAAIPKTGIENELNRIVSNTMDKSGLFYRIFSRVKTQKSVQEKFAVKDYCSTYKMQDLIGIRIALYFKDDIDICRKIIENTYSVIDVSEDIEDMTNFKAVRLNYVCKLPQNIKEMLSEHFWSDYYIDDTFEIQIRTVFSEGWHEIEHDLRYKCKQDWALETEASRILNGIFATLETCDWSILSLFDQMAYRKYKEKSWAAMIRNKLRIRFSTSILSDEICSVFEEDMSLAKEILKIEREKIIMILCSSEMSGIPKSLDNIVFILNAIFLRNSKIENITPEVIKMKCETIKTE